MVARLMAGPVLFSFISAFIGLVAGLIGIRIVGYEKGFGHSVSRRCIMPNQSSHTGPGPISANHEGGGMGKWLRERERESRAEQ